MLREVPASITIEEAVAEMVNMDYIPAGFTLLEMIAAFHEEAEVEYENAGIDRLPEDQIAPLKIRMESCRARHDLARLLLDSLQYEVKHLEGSLIVLAEDSSSHQRLNFDSVSDWAADRYGIGIARVAQYFNVSGGTQDANKVEEILEGVCWEVVTIKIWADYKIGYSIKGGNYKKSHFRKIGLMGMDKNDPNEIGGILIGLSQKRKFPPQKRGKGDSVAMSKLRDALRNLTGLQNNPFYSHNGFEGWVPRFKLEDDRNSTENRAVKRGKHVSFDDDRYQSIDDD